MQNITCPKCGEVFQVDESGYAAIVKQVRDREFTKEIKDRETQSTAERDAADADLPRLVSHSHPFTILTISFSITNAIRPSSRIIPAA